MRGELVIVRDCERSPLVRRVWSAGPNAVYICDEENFRRLATGEAGLPPVGFPRQDVFNYEPNVVEDVQWSETNPLLWAQLSTWEEGRNVDER